MNNGNAMLAGNELSFTNTEIHAANFEKIRACLENPVCNAFKTGAL